MEPEATQAKKKISVVEFAFIPLIAAWFSTIGANQSNNYYWLLVSWILAEIGFLAIPTSYFLSALHLTTQGTLKKYAGASAVLVFDYLFLFKGWPLFWLPMLQALPYVLTTYVLILLLASGKATKASQRVVIFLIVIILGGSVLFGITNQDYTAFIDNKKKEILSILQQRQHESQLEEERRSAIRRILADSAKNQYWTFANNLVRNSDRLLSNILDRYERLWGMIDSYELRKSGISRDSIITMFTDLCSLRVEHRSFIPALNSLPAYIAQTIAQYTPPESANKALAEGLKQREEILQNLLPEEGQSWWEEKLNIGKDKPKWPFEQTIKTLREHNPSIPMLILSSQEALKNSSAILNKALSNERY